MEQLICFVFSYPGKWVAKDVDRCSQLFSAGLTPYAVSVVDSMPSLVRPLLPTHITCRGWLLHLITFTTPHSVGLLWAKNPPLPDTFTWQHTIFTRNRQPCCRRDSNPQSQRTSGRTPTWPPESVVHYPHWLRYEEPPPPPRADVQNAASFARILCYRIRSISRTTFQYKQGVYS
jgi:hypothetical protein